MTRKLQCNTTYTIGPITANCTVTASFAIPKGSALNDFSFKSASPISYDYTSILKFVLAAFPLQEEITKEIPSEFAGTDLCDNTKNGLSLSGSSTENLSMIYSESKEVRRSEIIRQFQ